MKKTLPIIVIILIVIGLGVWWRFDAPQVDTENIGNELEKIDLVRLEAPRPNQVIKSPLIVRGEARGYWFFEASFPIYLTNWDGLIIAQDIATAKGDPATGELNWMTENFVPFEATLTFESDKNAYSNRGTLILRKDNPSGLPEHDDALEIPVIFEKVDESDDSGILPFNSGVSGTVSLGPICPVMREGDDSCADRSFQTTVQVMRKNDIKNSLFASVETDNDGWYRFALPPDEYTLQPIGGKPFPSCGSTDVIIEPDKMIEVNLSCDTGIR